MARIRTIKPEFPQSETIGRLSRDARLLFVQLWTIADDAGRARAASRMLASLLYPYDDDAGALIEGWLDELELKGCIHRYEVDGSHYLQICNWLKHQKIDRPTASRIPEFDERSRKLASPREHSTTDLGPVPVPRTSIRDQGPARAREDLDRVEGLLRQAAGLENDPTPSLFDLSPILGLIDAGYDLERQICPVIKTVMRKQKPTFRPRGWAYFVPAIQEAHGKRQAAAAVQARINEPDEVKWRRMFDMYKRGTWAAAWGPPPGESGCPIPDDLLRKWEAEAA